MMDTRRRKDIRVCGKPRSTGDVQKLEKQGLLTTSATHLRGGSFLTGVVSVTNAAPEMNTGESVNIRISVPTTTPSP